MKPAVAAADAEIARPDGRIAVALSGGGHRACLYALGALLYLAEAGKNAKVTSIASVSGGSMANGAVAQSFDFTAGAGAAEMRVVTARVAGQLTGKGSVFAGWTAKAYLALLAVFGVAALVGAWYLPTTIWIRIAIFIVGLLAVAWLARQRGRVCAKAFENALFKGAGRPTQLDAIQGGLDHVFCATDLHAGENIYFARDFVRSYRFGSGVPGDVKLSEVVQASAAFPGVFPVTWLPTARHEFVNPADPTEDDTTRASREAAAKTKKMALVDGGVYDNMGDQWAQGARADNPRGPDELVVVNASPGLGWKSLRRLRIPLLGELTALLRDKAVLYDNGNSLRRQMLHERFIQAARAGKGLRGTLVHISRSPFEIPRKYARGEDELSARARAALALLGADGPDADAVATRWQQDATANAALSTTLLRTDPADAARLLHHAYVLAMVNLHVILGYPLLELPGRERFVKLAAGEIA
jgi:predicted acylesterase/phospholipase RssA